MNDFPTHLRVIAAFKAGEDLAQRLESAVKAQNAMADALRNAADEIERLQELRKLDGESLGQSVAEYNTMKEMCVNGKYLTDAEREVISEVVDCLTDSGTALASPTTTRNTLAALLERLK